MFYLRTLLLRNFTTRLYPSLITRLVWRNLDWRLKISDRDSNWLCSPRRKRKARGGETLGFRNCCRMTRQLSLSLPFPWINNPSSLSSIFETIPARLRSTCAGDTRNVYIVLIALASIRICSTTRPMILNYSWVAHRKTIRGGSMVCMHGYKNRRKRGYIGRIFAKFVRFR